jgi:hypothetical protein
MVQDLRNISKKQLAIAIVAIVLLFPFAFGNTCSAVDDGDEVGMLVENIVASLDCDTATFNLACSISSADISLVHFPSPVDMNDTSLKNCTVISVVFTTEESILTFHFNDTSESNARANADAMIPSMNAAFDVTFAHNSTVTYPLPYPYVAVIYTAEGKSDMSTFLTSLKTECIGADAHGFSEVLPTLFTHADNKTVMLIATNASSTWYNMLAAEYSTAFPLGSGQHTVNILYYLGTGSLQPSEYAKMGIYYTSFVSLTVESSDTVTFVSCQPDEVTMPTISAGWYVPEKGPGNQISGILYFGNNPAGYEVITFTFQGVVISEFTVLTSIIAIMLISAILLHLRRHQRIKP